jgi:hypothetical protein
VLSRLVTSPLAFFIAGLIDLWAYGFRAARRRLGLSTIIRR